MNKQQVILFSISEIKKHNRRIKDLNKRNNKKLLINE
jgi:hypothetical protein